MDTPFIQGPQGTDTPGISPSTSQPDLAVAGEPNSKMVGDKRKLDDHAALDAHINDNFKTSMLDEANIYPLNYILAALLGAISKQIGREITPVVTHTMITQYDWLRDFLVAEWRKKSFTKVRRLSECPLCIFPVNMFT